MMFSSCPMRTTSCTGRRRAPPESFTARREGGHTHGASPSWGAPHICIIEIARTSCPPTDTTPLETEHNCRGAQCNARLGDNQELLRIWCARCTWQLFRKVSVPYPSNGLKCGSPRAKVRCWVRYKHSMRSQLLLEHCYSYSNVSG